MRTPESPTVPTLKNPRHPCNTAPRIPRRSAQHPARLADLVAHARAAPPARQKPKRERDETGCTWRVDIKPATATVAAGFRKVRMHYLETGKGAAQ